MARTTKDELGLVAGTACGPGEQVDASLPLPFELFRCVASMPGQNSKGTLGNLSATCHAV